MLSHIIKKSTALLNILHYKLLPATCILCRGLGQNFFDLCEFCEKSLPFLEGVCYQCSMPLISAKNYCGQCLNKTPHYDHTIALFHYQFPINRLIQDLKFNERLLNADLLGKLLNEKILAAYREDPLPECIIPVPLHHKRLSERGYNQALILSQPIAKSLSIPINSELCERTVHTTQQTKMTAEERRRNLRDAFSVKKNNFSHVVLMDDVMTTGSTVDEISKSLKKTGIKRVDVWCVARTNL
jgi:ComF family protein